VTGERAPTGPPPAVGGVINVFFFAVAAAAYLPASKTSPSPAFNSRRVPRSIDGRRTLHRRSDYLLTELPVSCSSYPSRLPLVSCETERRARAFRRSEGVLRRRGNSIGFGPMGMGRFVFVLLVFSCCSSSRFAGDLSFFLSSSCAFRSGYCSREMAGRIVVVDCLIALDWIRCL
jgi:hypothetical protein